VDVVVRPEACGRRQPDRGACRDYGALGPVLGMTAAIMSAPIRLLEAVFPPIGWCSRPTPQCGLFARPPHPGCPRVPPAGYTPPYPGSPCGPVPVCMPAISVPAIQKCVPRLGYGVSVPTVYPQVFQGQSGAVRGSR